MPVSDVESIMLDKIDQKFLVDRIPTKLGWVSLANEDYSLGPKYLISYNYPAKVDEFSYIEQFIRKAKPDVIRSFYRECNGLRVFSDAFVVPGVRFDPGHLDALDFFNIPLDFMVLGGVSLPEHCPVEGFQIGASQSSPEDASGKLHDIVDAEGRIISGAFGESEEVIEMFEGVSQWLMKRIVSAQNAFVQGMST